MGSELSFLGKLKTLPEFQAPEITEVVLRNFSMFLASKDYTLADIPARVVNVSADSESDGQAELKVVQLTKANPNHQFFRSGKVIVEMDRLDWGDFDS